MPIIVGPYYLTHPVNFPCRRKLEYPVKSQVFGLSVDLLSFHMKTGSLHIETTQLRIEPATLELGEIHVIFKQPGALVIYSSLVNERFERNDWRQISS